VDNPKSNQLFSVTHSAPLPTTSRKSIHNFWVIPLTCRHTDKKYNWTTLITSMHHNVITAYLSIWLNPPNSNVICHENWSQKYYQQWSLAVFKTTLFTESLEIYSDEQKLDGTWRDQYLDVVDVNLFVLFLELFHAHLHCIDLQQRSVLASTSLSINQHQRPQQ